MLLSLGNLQSYLIIYNLPTKMCTVMKLVKMGNEVSHFDYRCQRYSILPQFQESNPNIFPAYSCIDTCCLSSQDVEKHVWQYQWERQSTMIQQ